MRLAISAVSEPNEYEYNLSVIGCYQLIVIRFIVLNGAIAPSNFVDNNVMERTSRRISYETFSS